MTTRAARYLSFGAGVQSSTLLLLAVQGRIPTFDAAIFADTSWEPAAVYRHLDRLTGIARRAGVEVVRVSSGDIRADALDPAHRFASMPLFTLGPNGERGMARRQCTSEYKIKPIKVEVRRRLGYPHPRRVPAGVVAEMAIGISVDEVHRARDADVGYMRNVDWSTVTPVDIVTAGFPCQDISNAGKRAGITGEHSSLWNHIAAAVRVLRPRLLFVENVAALLRRGFDVVHRDLAEIGYDTRWLCLRASDIGAAHRRDRLFLLATPTPPDRRGTDVADTLRP